MADRRHAVLYAHSRHLSGVFLRSSDPLGKTVSRWPKQSGYFSWVSFISFWLPDDWDSILNGNSSQTLLVLQIIFPIHPGDMIDIITNINGIDVNSTTYGSSLNTLEVTFGAGIALNIGDTIGFYANNISGIMPIGLSITLNIQ